MIGLSNSRKDSKKQTREKEEVINNNSGILPLTAKKNKIESVSQKREIVTSYLGDIKITGEIEGDKDYEKWLASSLETGAHVPPIICNDLLDGKRLDKFSSDIRNIMESMKKAKYVPSDITPEESTVTVNTPNKKKVAVEML